MTRPMRQDLLDLFIEAEDCKRNVVAFSEAEAKRLNRAVASGRVVKTAGRTYARPETWAKLKPEERHLHVLRAMAERKRNLVFTHTSAAAVYGLWVSNKRLEQVHIATTARAHSRSTANVRRHVIAHDTSEVVNGIRVTSLERTVFDCLLELPFLEALPVVDSALRMGVSRERLQEKFEIFGWHVPDGKRPLEILALADPLSENGGESMSRAQMIGLGFKAPQLQVPIQNPMNPYDRYRVDFLWKLPHDQRIVGELDGHDKYEDPIMTQGRLTTDILLAERQRESRIWAKDGIRVMRFTYAQMRNRSYFERLLETYGVPRVVAAPEVARRPSRRRRHATRNHFQAPTSQRSREYQDHRAQAHRYRVHP